MHKQISLVHVSLHECLVLLGIPTSNHQIVLTCDEPNELLEPEHFALYRSNLGLLQFLKVTGCCLLGLFNGYTRSIFCLYLFLVRFLTDLEVLLNVELR